ncbi:hypothetical protein BJG01_02915 [Vibrio splendidus]|nr:hypothetical protein BJG01_02915 [Vibrio splendidus]
MSEQQQLWNSFLSRWPREKLNGLTLEEYVSVNDDDTFTYWLETKTRELGSIQGNTSAKFGIYKRGSEGREQNGIGHGEVYTWRTRYGDNELEVFNYVKKIIIQIAQAAYDGDLNTIDSIDFAPLVKWKIAFLYQNQQVPALINTFSKPMLLVLTDSNNKTPYPKMYKQLIDSMGGVNLLEYGEQCWKEAESKKKEIERQTILEQFSHIGAFQSGLELWPQATTNAFCDLISEANKQKLDIFVTDMDSGGMIRIGRKDVTDFRAKAVFATFEPTLSKIKFEQRYLHKNSYECLDVDNQLLLSLRESKNLRAFTKEFPISRKSHWPEDYEYTDLKDGEIKRNNTKIEEDNEAYNMSVPSATNQILYGPPGTGKTYHTIEAAVKAAEPEFIWNNRDELKAEYERLVSDKRIRFVTFHQSYGYEEFVEGLRAETDEENNIHYSIKDGAFKAISNKAAAQHVATPSLVNDDSRIWQLSIESSGKSEIKNHCLECDIGAIGWGHVGDMTPSNRTKESDETLAEESYPNQSTIRSLCNEMSVGDIVFCVSGQWTIEAIGVVTGDYEFRPGGVMHREDYCHTRPIKWLAKGLELNVFDLNCQTRLPIKTCSELTRFSLSELLAFLGENNVKLVDDIAPKNENHVLVIDEINRGNISKIFGELITLIEPSKRAGEDESLELTLPYSGKPFSVPNNLHIVGTMNTADRSLAMMDTALRRRFDFVE